MKKIVYCSAPWCPQCRAMKPRYQDLCEKQHIELEIHDVDEDEEFAAKFNIRNLPYVLVYRDGELTDRGMAGDILKTLEAER